MNNSHPGSTRSLLLFFAFGLLAVSLVQQIELNRSLADESRLIGQVPSPAADATTRACGLDTSKGKGGLMGRAGSNWMWKCGNQPLYREVGAYCEGNGPMIVVRSPHNTCVSWTDMENLAKAECAKRQCPYPMVCKKIVLDRQSVTTQPAVYFPSRVGTAKGVCTDLEDPQSPPMQVEDRWPAGELLSVAVAKLEAICRGKAMQTCRPGTAADYPNGVVKKCTVRSQYIPSVAATICPAMRTSVMIQYTCSNGTAGTYAVPKAANGKAQCISHEELQKKAEEMCEPCQESAVSSAAVSNVQKSSVSWQLPPSSAVSSAKSVSSIAAVSCTCGVKAMRAGGELTSSCGLAQFAQGRFGAADYECQDGIRGTVEAQGAACMTQLQILSTVQARCTSHCRNQEGATGICPGEACPAGC